MRKAAAAFACAAALSGVGWASDPTDETMRVVRPSVPPPDTTPRTVAVNGGGPSQGDSARPGALKGVRAVSTRAGEATVVLGGGTQRVLRVGDAVGADVVKAIDAGRIVLSRSGGPAGGGDATVIVTFDAQGRGRVRVFSTQDPSSTVPPSVR